LVCAACARNCSPSVARPASESETSRNAVWIAFSYCAIAMSLLTLAVSRLAWLRPASKIGCSSVAVPVSPKVPLLNRSPSSRLAVAGVRGQRDAREERGARRADVRVRGQQLLFGRPHVGSACQQVGRQPRRQIAGDDLLAGERQAGRQVGGQGLAQQQHQRVLVERALALSLRERRTRAFEQLLGLAEVEFRRGTVVELELVSLNDSSRVFSVSRVTRSSSSSDSSAT